MLGKNWTDSGDVINELPEEVVHAREDAMGIIPRCLSDIFEALNEKAATGAIEFSIRKTLFPNFDEVVMPELSILILCVYVSSVCIDVQLLQIYNEKIYDLLHDKRRENPLQLREAARHNGRNDTSSSSAHVYVQGLAKLALRSGVPIIPVYSIGNSELYQ